MLHKWNGEKNSRLKMITFSLWIYTGYNLPTWSGKYPTNYASLSDLIQFPFQCISKADVKYIRMSNKPL